MSKLISFFAKLILAFGVVMAALCGLAVGLKKLGVIEDGFYMDVGPVQIGISVSENDTLDADDELDEDEDNDENWV